MTQIYLGHFNLYRNQSYDDRGRITSSYLNTTSGGASALSYRYQYDNYGNRTVKKYFYGGGIMYQYTWTRGRLLDKILYSNDTALAEYTYDVNGVRYTKTADGVTTTYFYDGNTLLGENRSDGTRLRYFYDATGLCGFSYYNGSDTKYYTYVKDVLGNIVMIKDDMGLPLVKYTYNEWGVCSMTAFNLDGGDANALEAEIGDINPFRYRGYYYDSESGLYYLMSRYYDPEIGQFISMDTPDYLAPETIGGVDLYAYCNNNPIMYVDSTGHEPEWWHWIVGGLVITAATVIMVTGAAGIAGIIGASAAVANAMMINAGVATAMAGIANLWLQSENDFDDFNVGSLIGDMALSGTVGMITGGIGGALGALSAGAKSAAQIVVHKGVQVLFNTGISTTFYLLQSSLSGKEVTLSGLATATIGGLVLGCTFNWSNLNNIFGLTVGLNFLSYAGDIFQGIRNLKNYF